jgi:hypothetical protein
MVSVSPERGKTIQIQDVFANIPPPTQMPRNVWR